MLLLVLPLLVGLLVIMQFNIMQYNIIKIINQTNETNERSKNARRPVRTGPNPPEPPTMNDFDSRALLFGKEQAKQKEDTIIGYRPPKESCNPMLSLLLLWSMSLLSIVVDCRCWVGRWPPPRDRNGFALLCSRGMPRGKGTNPNM